MSRAWFNRFETIAIKSWHCGRGCESDRLRGFEFPIPVGLVFPNYSLNPLKRGVFPVVFEDLNSGTANAFVNDRRQDRAG